MRRPDLFFNFWQKVRRTLQHATGSEAFMWRSGPRAAKPSRRMPGLINSGAKLIALFFLFLIVVAPGSSGSALAVFFSTTPSEYDLVALLVEKDLYELTQNVAGIPHAQTPTTTLKSRIDRFAEDLQNDLENTRALIIKIDQQTKTEDIAHVLERFYFEGDPDEPDKNGRLKGVIVIGNVPLPVVSKGGSRFVSLFPYTDFEKKTYVRNPQTGDFERDKSVLAPQPEIWHGVIRPPVERSESQYLSLIAKFLDKNHLYKIGNEAYSEFGKNVFYADLFWEKKNINPFMKKRHENYLKYAEDIAYFRYTKEFFNRLLAEVQGELEEAGVDEESMSAEEQTALEAQQRATIEAAKSGAQAALAAEGSDVSLPAGSAMEEPDTSVIPDIQTKELINKYLAKFVDLFTKYPALINDFIRYTGRYTPNQVDSFVNLVVAKDQFTFGYLKEANTMVEKEIDEIIGEDLQKDIPLLEDVTIEVREVKLDGGEEISLSEEPTAFHQAKFVNHSPEIEVNSGDFSARILGKELDGSVGNLLGKNYGSVVDEVDTVADCSLFRGSPATTNAETGEPRISKLIEGNRLYDPYTGGTSWTTDEWENSVPGDDEQDFGSVFEEHAGCFYDNQAVAGDLSKNRCFPEAATDPVFSYRGTKKKSSRPIGSDDFRACFNFHFKDQYEDYSKALDYLLEALSEDNIDPDDDEYADPAALEAMRAAMRLARMDQIVAIAGAPGALDDYENLRFNQIPKDKAPNDIILFQNEDATVRFSHILNGLGIPATQLFTGTQQDYVDISVPNHSAVESVTFRVIQNKVKDLSSIFVHKEPTYLALREQNESQVALDLPIDNPRYVTFQDQSGTRRQIIYPNIFQAPTFAAYLESLQAIEQQLNTINGGENAFTGRLTSKIANISDQPVADPERNNQTLAFSRMNRPKVEDALNWRWLDIEAKHRYLLETYLNPFKNGYIGEREHGYEMLVLNATGEHDSFHIDLRPEGEINPEIIAFQDQQAEREEGLQADAPDDGPNFGEFDQPFHAVDPLYLFTFETSNVDGQSTHFPWFVKFQEWMSNVRSFGEELVGGESADDFYAHMREKQEADRLALDEEISKEDEQAFDAAEDQGNFSRVHSVSLSSSFPVLLSGGDSKAEVLVRLKDEDGKLIEDEVSEVTVSIEGDSVVLDPALQDLNAFAEGFQAGVLGKEFFLTFVSTDRAGESTVTVKVSGTNRTASFTLRAFEDIHFELFTNLLGVRANGVQEIPLTVRVVDGRGSLISSVNGQVSLSVSDERFGVLLSENIELMNGQGNVKFKVAKKAGRVTIEARGGGLPAGRIELTLLPGPPSFLGLETDEEFLNFTPGSLLKLRGKIFDEFGNTVMTDNQTKLQFEILSSDENAYFSNEDSVRVTGGVAEINLFPGEKIGKVRVRVRDTENHLTPALREIPVRMEMTYEDIQENSPETLTAALLGFDGGNVTKPNFLAGWFAFSGKNQATISLTEKPKTSLPLIEISPQGIIHILEPSEVTADIVSGIEPHIIFRDQMLQETLAEMVVTPKSGTNLILGETTFPPRARSDIERFASSRTLAPLPLAALAREPTRPKLVPAAEASAGSVAVTSPTIEFILLNQKFSASLLPNGQKIRLSAEGKRMFELTKTGGIHLFNDELELKLGEGDALTFLLKKGDETLAKIIFHQSFDSEVRIASGGGPFSPGITVLSHETLSRVRLEPFFAGNSTNSAKGIRLVSTTRFVSGRQAPGFQTNGLEDSLDVQGVGFMEGNKFGQLFAAGNSFGESMKPYISDIGIIIGDPTVHVEKSSGSGFTADSGSFLFRSQENVRELVSLDYDLDGDDDLFIVFGAGSIQLLENRGEKRGFLDRGEFIRVGNGIASLAKGDINNDGRMDLVIAGVDTCRRGDTCLDYYENKVGYFERRNIPIQQEEHVKIEIVKTGDLNHDGKLDLLTFDTKGNLRAYYNRSTFFETQGQLIGNLGLTVSPSQNLAQSVMANYSAMPEKNPEDPKSAAKYQELQWLTEDPSRSLASSVSSFPGASAFSEDTPLRDVKEDFIYADLDPRFDGSTQFAADLNGGVVENEDRLRYTLTLKNDGPGAVNDLKFAILIPEEMEIDLASIRCTNCPASEQLRAHETTSRARPYYFFGLRMPAGSERIVTYEVTYHALASQDSSFVITVGNNLSNEYPVRDQYLDIMVTTEDNPTGRVRFYYSNGLNAQGRVIYTSQFSSPPDHPPITRGGAAEAAGDYLNTLANADNLADSMQSRAERAFEDRKTGDEDEDGIPDSLDDVSGRLDQVNEVAQNLVNSLKCDAGCIPLPLNAAFLAPGNFSSLGVPGPFDPGRPVIGFPTTFPTFIWPANSPFQISSFRLYLSPTLTGGLGTGLCFGTYLLGQCITFAVDALSAAGVCDSIQGGIESAMSVANNAIRQANQGLVLNVGGAQGGGGSNTNPRESGGLVNYSLGSYQASSRSSSNRRIPGFPAVITDWARAQLDEFIDKLLDFPDIYFIYPKLSFAPVIPEQEFRSFTDLLTFLNSIPLLNIETEDTVFKVPIVTRKEFERFKYDARLWMQDLAAEWEKAKAAWQCLTLREMRDFCDIVDVRVSDLISSMNKNLDNLEEWILLPKRILDYRNIEAYFARQIIDYLDTIVQYTGGYLKKQEQLMNQWVRAIRNIIRIIRDWQALLDIFVDYQESCDKCKSERYQLVDLILRLFIALPSPPVIPFPKWPDFVIDISKIQAGLIVRWPALRLQPTPLVLPKIPRIRFPTFPFPQITVLLPDIPVIPGPPPLPELPALPPLPLPQLPDLLPPPPKLPPLPGQFRVVINILKKVVKLICILKTGLMPVSEAMLKSEIEWMTARGLNPLLPIDFLVTIQAPTISVEYVDQVKFTNYLNFNFENQQAVEAVREVSQRANSYATNLAKQWKKFWEEKVRQVEKYTSPKLPFEKELLDFTRSIEIDVGSGTVRRRTNYRPEETQAAMITSFFEYVFQPMLEGVAAQNQKAIASNPETVTFSMTSEPFQSSNDPNRLKAIKSKRSSETFSTEFEKNLAHYRDNLISYVDGIEQQNEFLSRGDFMGASKIAFTLPSSKFLQGKKRLLASPPVSEGPRATDSSPAPKNSKVKIGELNFDRMLEEASDGAPDKPRMIAQGGGGAGGGGGGGEGAPDIPVANLGLYIADPETGESKRILAYTGESDLPRKILFIDFDDDGDDDLIYTTGPDVFLKEYRGGSPASAYHFSEDYIEHFNFEELLPSYAAVNHFTNVSESTREAVIEFSPAERAAEGYELQLKRSPKFFDGAGDSPTTFVDLLPVQDLAPEPPNVTSGEVNLQRFPLQTAFAVIDNLSGNGQISGKKRTLISSGSGETRVFPDESIHPLGEARIEFIPPAGDPYTLELQPFHFIPITNFFGSEVNIRVKSGKVEIIGRSQNTQALQEGMMVAENDRISVTSGNARLRFANGGIRMVRRDDTYAWAFLRDPTHPLANLSLETRHFYGKVRSFSSGSAGVLGENILLALQECGDTTPPFANAGSKKFEVALLKTLSIDASRSYDGQGEITKYVLDLDRETDSNGDNDPANDTDLERLPGDPIFTVGPFGEVGERKARLIVFDEAMNPGYQDIDIQVIMPQIILSPEELRTGKVHGYITPRDSDVPITLARQRDGIWQKLTTPSAETDGRYRTDVNGNFAIDDLDLRDRLIVRNSEGVIVAEINRKLGTVIILDENSYHLEVLPAAPPNLPTRVAIVDQRNVTLTFVFLVPDINTDVTIDAEETVYDLAAFESMNGVHMKPAGNISSDFTLRSLPGDSLEAPGAVEVLRRGERLALVDVNGDVLFASPYANRLKLQLKQPVVFEKPMVLEFLFDNQVIAEIFIMSHFEPPEFVEIVDEANVEGVPRPRPTLRPGETPFLDIRPQDPLSSVLRNLYDKGIMQGYQDSRGNLTFQKEKLITRAEFAKVTLDMLCIAPRKEAFELPAIFSDVPFKNPLDWFYSWTKEANLQHLIFGYQRERDPATNLYPYRPGTNINRAEASKILLEALDTLGVIDMSKVNRDVQPWFAPFIEIAKNLEPYVVGEKETKSSFLLTSGEANQPTAVLSRGDVALMADRVLKLRNCYLFDTDNDGLKDEWEKDNFGDLVQGADDDPDRDTLLNAEEESIGTDPLDPDTDAGGISDGVEVKVLRTDPLLIADDRPLADREALENEENIYVVRPTCMSCPCRATVELGSQLLSDDMIFAGIIDENTSEIFIRSEELKYP